MKQQITPVALIISGVVLILVLIFFGWKTFGSQGDTVDSKTVASRIAAKDAKWKGH